MSTLVSSLIASASLTNCSFTFASKVELSTSKIIVGQEHPEIQSILVDVLIVVDAECSLEENEEHKTRLAKVI